MMSSDKSFWEEIRKKYFMKINQELNILNKLQTCFDSETQFFEIKWEFIEKIREKISKNKENPNKFQWSELFKMNWN